MDDRDMLLKLARSARDCRAYQRQHERTGDPEALSGMRRAEAALDRLVVEVLDYSTPSLFDAAKAEAPE